MRYDHASGSLWFGDCLELMRDIPDGSVDCVVTDPAYKTITGGTEHSKRTGAFQMFANDTKSNDGSIFAHNAIRISDYMPHLFRVLKPGTHCYVMINNLNLRELLNVADAVGLGFHNLLRWDKNNRNPNRWYMKDCEYTCFFYKKPAKTINNKNSRQGFPFDNLKTKSHPTEKPVELMRHYIENSTQPGECVLDPFSGVGTTAVAARASGRRSIGIELDLTYYARSVARVAAL